MEFFHHIGLFFFYMIVFVIVGFALSTLTWLFLISLIFSSDKVEAIFDNWVFKRRWSSKRYARFVEKPTIAEWEYENKSEFLRKVLRKGSFTERIKKLYSVLLFSICSFEDRIGHDIKKRSQLLGRLVVNPSLLDDNHIEHTLYGGKIVSVEEEYEDFKNDEIKSELVNHERTKVSENLLVKVKWPNGIFTLEFTHNLKIGPTVLSRLGELFTLIFVIFMFGGLLIYLLEFF